MFKFIKRLESFTKEMYKFTIVWKTKKIRSLFPIKDKVKHNSNVIYEGTCTCGDKYIGETKRNAEIRFKEHNSSSGKSEPSKHLLQNLTHSIDWKILCKAPRDNKKRKILESYFICKFKPNINDQLDIRFLRLFRNGVT